MKTAAKKSLSLARRLFYGLVGPTAALALLLGAGGAWAIHSIVEAVNDRLLGASAHAIAETLGVDAGEITLDLPPWALGMLENAARDNIYYNVHAGGRLVTGYPDLPPPEQTKLADQQVFFRYGKYRGQRVRIAAEARRLPRIEQLVVVQVAETLAARRMLSRHMLIRLVVLEIALLALAALMIPIGLRWGLTPLTRLRRAIDARSAADFAPLPLEDVPRELKDLVATFNALLTRLDKAAEGARRFTADASHQMRTPLSILRTHLEVLKSEAHTATSQESLADIEAAADRLQRLFIQLLALARAEGAEPSGVALHAIDVGTIVRGVAAQHAPDASRAGVELHFTRDSVEPLIARGDEMLLTELIGNLVDNAVRYNRSGGTVSVSVFRAEDRVCVEVEDDGPSIPPHEREKVFTRFYRLARDQAQPGSGLGLSIVQVLGQLLGAHITLADGPAVKGLRVRVALPRLERIE